MQKIILLGGEVGHIKKVLAMGELEPRSAPVSYQIWTDLCENVHLHYRNNRFDFSEEEFAMFRAAINHLGLALEKSAVENNYREGDPNFLIQQVFNHKLKTDSDYYPNRYSLELQRDNTVHFHYRDLRIHWTFTEFVAISKMFVEAIRSLKSISPFPYKPETKTLYRDVPIDLIQPYDEGHRPLVFDKDHRNGIEYVKGLIISGKKIRPILVNTDGQRLDGFKRYMAHKELGLKAIDCIVDPFGVMGGQHNQSLLEEK